MMRATFCGGRVGLFRLRGTFALLVTDNDKAASAVVELSMEDAEALIAELAKFIENENENRACGGPAVSR